MRRPQIKVKWKLLTSYMLKHLCFVFKFILLFIFLLKTNKITWKFNETANTTNSLIMLRNSSYFRFKQGFSDKKVYYVVLTFKNQEIARICVSVGIFLRISIINYIWIIHMQGNKVILNTSMTSVLESIKVS